MDRGYSRLLLDKLKKVSHPTQRKKILLLEKNVKEFFTKKTGVKKTLESLSLEYQVIFLSLVAMGMQHLFIQKSLPQLKSFLKDLEPADRFFRAEGGILFYQSEVLQLLHEKPFAPSEIALHPFGGIDIREGKKSVIAAILSGIKSLPYFAEVYAVGGAADRLNLKDPKSGKELPAACLILDGKTLFLRLIEDVQAKEYLYYKIFGMQVTTPIALMTSLEKDNHLHIQQICKESRWFGRHPSSFHLFDQPLVPVIDRKGQWQLDESKRLFLKPGGHGVIWKLAEDRGVLKALQKLKKTKLLIRQINNPVAGVDYGLLVLGGIGFAKNKKFGFASCERLVHSAEGMDILVEKKTSKGKKFVLTNIEYCDFTKFGIPDEPKTKKSPYSKFPSNTNVLFADIAAMRKAVKKMPLPGKILNFKQLAEGKPELARLETTMQNIADSFEENTPNIKSSFLTFNTRVKTIAATKRQHEKGGDYLETPEAAFYAMMSDAYDLCTHYLKIQVDPCSPLESFFKKIPFIFTYHPALGPLYSVIAQKIKYGALSSGAELRLQIAELEMQHLFLKGSLLIDAKQPLGQKDKDGILHFKNRCGRCTLKNVRIENEGLDLSKPLAISKAGWKRKEACHIVLNGFSEFHAEDICLKGNLYIEVEDGMRVVAQEVKGKLVLSKTKLQKPSWEWEYSLDNKHPVKLTKKALS